MEMYYPESQSGRNFSLERFDDSGHLESKLMSPQVDGILLLKNGAPGIIISGIFTG